MHDRTTLGAVALAALLVGSLLGAGLSGLVGQPPVSDASERDPQPITGGENAPSLATFDSDEAFREYFERDRSTVGSSGLAPTARGGTYDVAVETEEAADAPTGETLDDGAENWAGDGAPGGSGSESEPRYSGTNVQEAALDEPAVLKTDGGSVYYADYQYATRWSETHVVDVSDPADPIAVGSIPLSGELLLVGETLVVLADDAAAGYDVSDPADPEQRWRTDLGATVETARLHDGDLYLVLAEKPDLEAPCPLEPYGDATVECTDVVRPDAPADADAVYTAARVDPETGDLESEASVVGSRSLSATYVSESGIYLSYTRGASEYELLRSYVASENASEVLDAETRQRVAALDDLDVSEQAKAVELREILDDWRAGLDDDERRERQRALEEGLTDYVEVNQRSLTTTGIVRIGIDGALEADAHGEVPGTPLNQFSMDEHEDHLRVATTIPRTHNVDSENDVYVLDSDLETVGSVTGLGVDERIYSVRFEGDEGYVVTFREIDPFYTLDLSEPTDPTVDGELKLPGFSEYLHPLSGDLVLGIGQEDRRPKATLFDVSDPTDPTELDSVILEAERDSDVSRTHTAFLHDERHGVFFLPGSEHSYVFGYQDGSLEERARVDVGGPGTRGMYVGDFLYVFGEGEAVVLDERTWTETARLEL